MKLPGEIKMEVQTRGRLPVGGPSAVGNAEAAADMAWARTVERVSKDWGEIAEAQGLADANLALSERLVKDKKDAVELSTYMENTTKVNLSDTDIPAAAREAAEHYAELNDFDRVNGSVPTAEIVVHATEIGFKKSREESFAELQKHNQTDKTLAAYNNAMDSIWADGAARATKTQTVQRLENLKARADFRLSEAKNALDETEAINIILEAEQTGVYTPDVAAGHLAEVGPEIDYIRVHAMYREANTQAEVDAVDDIADMSRLTTTQRVSIMKLSDQRHEHMYTLDGRAQKVMYGEGQSLLTRGLLTRDWIVEKLAKQEITGGHANTLRSALDSPAPLKSNPRVMDNLQRKIARLRLPAAEDGYDEITERAADLRKEILSKFTGATDTGDFIDKSITGDDLDNLMTLIDDNENKALGKGGQSFQNAMASIKSHTGYMDSIAKMIDGPYPAGQAYAAFRIALEDYMNHMGIDADPTDFVAKNAHRFTADVYVGTLGQRLTRQFPQYADAFEGMVAGKGPVNDVQLLTRALADVYNGQLSQENYHTLRRSIMYMQYESDSQTSVGIDDE